MRRKKFLFIMLAVIFMTATPAMGQSAYADCSQKYLTSEKPILPFGDWSSGAFNRRIIFPWYAVGPSSDGASWETRIAFGYAAVPPPAGFKGGWYTVQFKTMAEMPSWATGLSFNVRFASTPGSEWLWGGLPGGNFFSIGEKIELHLRKASWWDGRSEQNHPIEWVNTGIVIVDFWAGVNSDPCIVNRLFDNYAYGQLTFLARRPDGTVEWQVSEPGVFVDQLSARWAAPINVSGAPSDPPDFTDFEDASFAVANAGDKEVRVRVSLFEQFGEPHDGMSYPAWQKTITLGPMRTEGRVIRKFFGEDALFRSIYPGSNYGGRPSGFRGTILFEAVDDSGNVVPGARIIPLVLQRVGDSLTNVQLVKLPPQKPTW